MYVLLYKMMKVSKSMQWKKIEFIVAHFSPLFFNDFKIAVISVLPRW